MKKILVISLFLTISALSFSQTQKKQLAKQVRTKIKALNVRIDELTQARDKLVRYLNQIEDQH